MGTYYNYFIGYKTPENIIYPLGPYDCFGNLKWVYTKSASYGRGLSEMFREVPDSIASDVIREKFTEKDWCGKDRLNLYWVDIDELPEDSFVKTGYYLISDIEEYLRTDDSFDLFYDRIDPKTYALRSQNEMIFGMRDEYDAEGNRFDKHSCGEYAFFAYPDYYSEEYEADRIRTEAGILHPYTSDIPEGSSLVALMTIS